MVNHSSTGRKTSFPQAFARHCAGVPPLLPSIVKQLVTADSRLGSDTHMPGTWPVFLGGLVPFSYSFQFLLRAYPAGYTDGDLL